MGNGGKTLPEEVELPDFVLIDLEQKKLLEVSDEGLCSAPIDAVSYSEGRVAFGGLDHRCGWSEREKKFLSAIVTNG